MTADSDRDSDDEEMGLEDGSQIEDRYTPRELEALDALDVETPETPSQVSLDLNSQPWQHHVDEEMPLISGQRYVVFTPPTTDESNDHPTAQQTAPVITPQVRRRIRRTREQIEAGITLDQLRQMRANE